MCALAIGFGIASNVLRLLVSYHASVASGPAIILTAGMFYLISVFAGPRGGLAGRLNIVRRRTA